MNPKGPTPRYIIIKIAKFKDKERNLKAAREKQEVTKRTKDLHRLRVRCWKKYSSKWAGKKAGVSILTSDKIDFKTKTIKRHPERHFIILKGRIH